MQLAFDIASKEIGIPPLLDVEDVCDVPKPDERSLMTYIAYWFHAFSQMEKVENAGRRVEKFAGVMQGVWEMQSSYEHRMAKLIMDIGSQRTIWKDTVFNGLYPDVKEHLSQFMIYKRTTKRTWVTEKSGLRTLLGNMQTKMSTYRLRPYHPPPTLDFVNFNEKWDGLLKAEKRQSRVINEKIGE